LPCSMSEGYMDEAGEWHELEWNSDDFRVPAKATQSDSPVEFGDKIAVRSEVVEPVKRERFVRRMPMSNAERQAAWRQRHPEEHRAYQREYMWARRAKAKAEKAELAKAIPVEKAQPVKAEEPQERFVSSPAAEPVSVGAGRRA
jgi:hypothetical protein